MALPAHARCVVIGCGIAGNSLAYHLTQLGWRDVVLLDKGPLPNPGGSTGHASNFIYLVDHSKEMTALTVDSVRQYQELGVFIRSGGIEVARTKERMQELTRRVASGTSWGIDGMSLLSPADVKEFVPYINEKAILGGFYTEGVGVVDSLRAGTLMREKGIAAGAVHVVPKTEVIGIDVEHGRVKRVRTTDGDIEAETVAITSGVWSPRLARMAGTRIPLTPAVHQMIDIGPVPRFRGATSDIEHPIVRDMDTNMYERQAGGDLEIGSYAHRPILYDPEDLPPVEQAALSPTEFPFTQADFEQQMQHALELMPEIVGDESVGVKYAINGILSLTPDGMPVLGESPDVLGLWAAAAVWWASNREIRLAPFHIRERELGAFFFEAAGWERPFWFESNAPLLEEFGERITRRTAEWESRWWSPIINAEHLAMRDRGGLFDLSAFTIFDIVGPGALASVQCAALRQMDVPVGRVVYTPVLSPHGGFKSDLTIMRLGEEHFRVVTGGAAGMSDEKWFRDQLVGGAELADLTSSMTTIGLWGPRARDIIASTTSEDVSNEGFKFGTCRVLEIGTQRVLASRISYVGDLGWELYVPIEQGLKLWDTLWEAGRPQGMVACGIGVYGTTGRLEKCYRAHGNELETEYNVVEAGMAAPRVKEEDFIGKAAHLRHREEDPVAILCTLTVDDHRSKSGEKRYMLGREPILRRDGSRIVDRRGRGSYVTSAGAGPSVGKHILMAYLTREEAVVGNQLLVEYMGERYPVSVAVVGATPLFDPENARIRGAMPENTRIRP